MKRILHTKSLGTKLLFLCMLFGLGSFSAMAQAVLTPPGDGKNILVYETDFRDWAPMAITNGTDLHAVVSGGGKGFSLQGRPNVEPTSSSCGLTGSLWFNQDNNYAITPQFNFVEGGVIEIWFCTNSSSARNMRVWDADAVGVAAPVPSEDGTATGRLDRIGVASDGATAPTSPGMAMGTASADRAILDPAKVGVYMSGNTFAIRGSGNLYKVSYRLPAAKFTGMKSVQFGGRDSRIMAVKIYSSVGSTPYVASTNYTNLLHDPNAGAYTMRGTVGGAAGSGTAVGAAVNVQGWNISGEMLLSLEGANAGKFSFAGANPDGTLTVSNADALSGFSVPLQFSPSVESGVAEAILVIADATNPSRNYKVALSGITDDGTTNPQLLAPVDVIPFFTSVIAPVSQQYRFAGIYLSSPVNITFVGPMAARLSASSTNISVIDASKGSSITITYTGTPSGSLDETTVMRLTTGSTVVDVPLRLETFELKPALHHLEFEANPSGTAVIKLSLTGPLYPLGSIVKVEVTPEAGYYITGWNDNATTAGTRDIRIRPDGTTPSLIVVNLARIGEGPTPTGGSFIAYLPGSVTADGFNAIWSASPNETPSTTYTVTVYAADGATVIGSGTAAAGATSCSITGLTPTDNTKEENFLFHYKVEANNLIDPDTGLPVPDESTAKVGPFRLTGTVSFTCGQ